ncbi:PH domain-containing protein [Cellulomonas alba]|uniref:PH domain-containing protein n=1 Tax=Cellulomonas alba TaxID=3053467 RepID=A0ABT7SIH0_9CELL|nr:PH domain-containing protein [Cellulomonas alba]MDM7855362.1 PH domain-containing protein [Cellulomonas alba]
MRRDTAPGPAPAPTDVDLATADWRRMHPITPALRGWKTLAVVVAVGWYQLGDHLHDAEGLVQGGRWLIAVGAVAAIVLVASAYATLAWRVTRFAVTDDAVHLNTGVLFRQHRQARLDRLQAVDVVQPLLARLVGLAELKLDVAGGAGANVTLSYLRESDALALRAELLALAAGLRRPAAPAAAPEPAGVVPPAPAHAVVPGGAVSGSTTPGTAAAHPVRPAFEEAPEREVYEVPMPRLIGASLRSAGAVMIAVFLVVAVVVTVLSRDVGAAFAFLPALFGGVGAFWSRINQGASFRAAISPDGIRLRHGLTEARTQTVPPGRVQAIRLTQGLWWRGRDWWRVEMNVAGYGQGADVQRETVLHPVATRAEAMTALWLVLPDLGVGDPATVVDAALSGRDGDGGFTPAPRRARWVDPIGWRRRGVLVTDRALLTRSGRLRRQVEVVPHERTQSLGLQQGPIQRRLRLATFLVHSTPGPVRPSVWHLDEHAAAALLDEQAERARTARAVATPEQWMRAVSDGGS